MGWRVQLGFLFPPGNPTAEPEMMQLMPPGALYLHPADTYSRFTRRPP